MLTYQKLSFYNLQGKIGSIVTNQNMQDRVGVC